MYLRIDKPYSSLGFIQELMWDLWWTKCQCDTLLSEGFTVHCNERSGVREMRSQLTPLRAQSLISRQFVILLNNGHLAGILEFL
jgi:hypothetical protein